MDKKLPKDIFTILYQVNGQRYVIGVSNDDLPHIAAMGVNTPRPLPQNIRTALVDVIKECKELKNQEPKVSDYNAPSSHFSKAILNNWSITPKIDEAYPARSVPEAVAVLKAKMHCGPGAN